MQLQSILYIAYTNTSIIISLVLALLFWNRRHVIGAKWMALMMSSAALWGLSDFLSDLCKSNAIKQFWENASYLGIVIIPVAWLTFALEFTKYKQALTRRRRLKLWIIPTITLLMVWTNESHHLVVSNIEYVEAGQFIILDPTFNLWFWIHAGYSYLLLVLGTLLLVRKLVGLPSILRSQYIIMITAIAVPLGMNMLYTFKINPIYPMDPTIFSFTVTGIFCFVGMFRYKLFDLIPQARNAVIEEMSGILFVLDNKNHILDINSAAKALVGVKEINFVGKPITEVLGKWSNYFAKYEQVQQWEEKISIQTSTGKRHFDLKITPLYDSKNKLMGKFLMMYDITVLEDAIEKLEASKQLAEAANKAKSQFLATMSHEIRTPLNGIIGMTELLTSARLTKEEKEYLQAVQGCADSLLGLINDILDFSKIEAGKLELEERVFNVKELIQTTVQAFSHQANEKGLQLLCNIDQTIPENLAGDPVRVKQILVNIIGNALKFTEKGKVEIQAEQLSQENQRFYLRLSIVDTGIGIPEDKLGNLFKSFEQVDSSTSRKYGGSGLGLAIVKDIVDIMGGRIDVESKPGEGSRFLITLPFSITGYVAPQCISKAEIPPSDGSITILLAEDSKVNQMLVVKLLEKKNLKVEVARNGQEVLYMMEEKAYDLILMDIQMPEMDGYEATRAIRRKETETGRHIPIIALTANATEADQKECAESGMDDFLTKPIKPEKLYEHIFGHLKRI